MKGANTMILKRIARLNYANSMVGYRVEAVPKESKSKGVYLHAKKKVYDIDLELWGILKEHFYYNIEYDDSNISSLQDINFIETGGYICDPTGKDYPQMTYEIAGVFMGFKGVQGADLTLFKEMLRMNDKYFNGEMLTNIMVSWNKRMTSVAGHCWTIGRNKEKEQSIGQRSTIALSTHYHAKYQYNETLDTLVHEMIHAKFPGHNHDYVFKNEMARLNREFEELNITIYSLGRATEKKVKYVYACVKCSQEYTRTRVMQYKRYSCGKCKGNLHEIELETSNYYINKMMTE